MHSVRNIILILLLCFQGPFVNAASCISLLTSQSFSWSKPGVLSAIELLAAAKISKVMRKRSYNPLSPFLSPDRYDSLLRRIGNKGYSVEAELAVKDPDYENAKTEAIKVLTDRNYGISLFSPEEVKLELPVLAKFLGDDFLKELSSFSQADREGVRSFMVENIEAIVINALAFPRSGRVQRVGHAVRVNQRKYFIPGVCTAVGCTAGAAALSFGLQELAGLTDTLLIEDVGLVGAILVGGIGAAVTSWYTTLGVVRTPVMYLSSSANPGYDDSLYNHEVGQAVRDRYSRR